MQTSGSISSVVRCEINGAAVKLTIGPFPAVSLQEAREQAGELLREIRLGRDPRKTKAQAQEAAAKAAGDMVEVVARDWREKHLVPFCRPRTLETQWARVTEHILPRFGKRPFADVRRAEVRQRVTPPGA